MPEEPEPTMNARFAAAAAAIAAALTTESIGMYPFRAASLAAQSWLLLLMLVVAAPYAAIAYFADQPSLARRAFAHGIALATSTASVLVPVIFVVMFVSVMSLAAEHPHRLEHIGQIVGGIAIVPLGFMTRHVKPVHLSAPRVVGFALANIWLAIAVRLTRQERGGLGDEGAKEWRRNRRLGVACGVAVPIALMFGRAIYERL
jgi:hypothetical protein